jgi:hypothetical protein
MQMTTQPKPELRLDWATHAAAKYACENWHYSKCLPAGKMVKIGAWESGKFIGVVIFSLGANNKIGNPYGLSSVEVCELTRIALSSHQTPVSRIMAICLIMLRKQSAGLKLIVSYADPAQGHHGGVYQANGWVYVGKSQAQREVILNGVLTHKRTINSKYGTSSVVDLSKKGLNIFYSELLVKMKYLMPLDAAMRTQIAPLAKPYPKRDKQAMIGVQPEQRRGSTDRHAPNSDDQASAA